MKVQGHTAKIINALKNAHRQGHKYLTLCELSRRSGINKGYVSYLVHSGKLSPHLDISVLESAAYDRVRIHHISLKGAQPAHKTVEM